VTGAAMGFCRRKLNKGDKVKIYKVKFTGRRIGAIGIFYRFSLKVKAENEEQATLKLYEKYEHIQQLEFKEVGTI
jgi:translation initiation factor IF-3